MIEHLIGLLRALGLDAGFFRLFDSLTFRIIMATMTALLLELLFGHRVIVALYRARMRDTGGHKITFGVESKRGTPTAGGTLIIGATVVSIALWGRVESPFLLAPAAAMLWFGAVGFFDDWLKVRLQSSLFGLGQAAKTVLQLAFIPAFAWWLVSAASPLPANLRTTISLPYLRLLTWDAGPWLFGAFVVFAFYAIVNAVNITDGLDGLVSWPALLTASVYGVFAYILATGAVARYLLFTPIPGAGELAVFAAALVGSLAGFLWYNTYPAEVFMGDTGSMAVGASLAVLAFLTRQELLFPIVGGVFVASIASSLIQQKIGDRIGRRIFLRAPIHHGWVQRGIAEPKVVARYWIVSLLLALVAALSLKVR